MDKESAETMTHRRTYYQVKNGQLTGIAKKMTGEQASARWNQEDGEVWVTAEVAAPMMLKKKMTPDGARAKK